ncbi:MAG TPA: spore protease YyaC, partial [Exiguobacterium sp.]|nr:spore protease YyaC [Exiguobacterium sp.]
MILQNTRLHLVYELAELVANSFHMLDAKLSAESTRTTISFTPRSM